MHKVTIHNYQSHKDTTLELSASVTSLEGTSDSGKSAVMRAMLWALTNKPDGTAFVSNWAKDKAGKVVSEASVTIDNISRIRSKDFNGYVHSTPDGMSRYEALKGGVPCKIDQAINMDDVNIQRQMDPPFLLSSTPGEAARYVNSLVGLDEIDIYQKALKGMAKDNTRLLQDEAARLSGLEKDLAVYDWVDGAAKKIQDLAQITSTVALLEVKQHQLSKMDVLTECDTTGLRRRLDDVARLISKYPDSAKLRSRQSSLTRLGEVAGLNEALGDIHTKLQLAAPHIEHLSGDRVHQLDNAVSLLNNGVKEVAACNRTLHMVTERIRKVNGLIDRGMALHDMIGRLHSFECKMSTVQSDTATIRLTKTSLSDTAAFLKGKSCPLCGTPLQDV